jgi:cyanophycinase-like exopeptidase
MGSGEMSPTMVRVHRQVLEAVGPPPVPAVVLDTPFGFQENAGELGQRAVTYFAESLQTTITVASSGARDVRGEPDPRVSDDVLAANVAAARYVFSGPGSPTYALRKWRETVVPQLLREKLTEGGAVTFASAAALTLGAFTVPVYEIYKVGADPAWLEGLDILSTTGMCAAIIPHFNNAEGGTHDTRYCYLGERRLRIMEEQLPADCFVLGLDEHTSLLLDLDARTALVGGLGVVTIRHHGSSVTFSTGERVGFDTLVDAATASRRTVVATAAVETPAATSSRSPLLDAVHSAEITFRAAIEARDGVDASAVVLGLDDEIHAWSTDIPGQDEFDRARASLRAMVIELGDLAEIGLVEPASVVGPYVDLLIELRRRARGDRRFSDADQIRDRLASIGVELRDGRDATVWELAPPTDRLS